LLQQKLKCFNIEQSFTNHIIEKRPLRTAGFGRGCAETSAYHW